MKILDMFSGVGGFSLGFHAANFERYDFGKFPHEQETESDGFYKTVAFCEIDEKCRKVLQKRFPGVPVLSDVRHVNRFTAPQADIICGGFPCQDLSIQGTKQGFDGERSSLFYEMLRAAKEVNAKYIVFENSAQLIRQKNTSLFLHVNCGIMDFGLSLSYYALRTSVIFTRGNARSLLPTPLHTDGTLSMKKFSMKQQILKFCMCNSKSFNRCWPFIIIWKQRENNGILTMNDVCQTYETLMGFPKGWTE